MPEGAPLELDTLNSDFGSILCFGEDAFVTLDAIGNSNVSFEWPEPINIVSAQTFAPAGTYVVTLTAGSCMSIDSFEVVQPDSIGVSIDLGAAPRCPGDLGTLTSNSSGGVDPIGLRWEDASGMVLSTDVEVNGIGPGTYTLFATDANGCTGFATTTITVPEPIEGFVGDIVQPICFNDGAQVYIDSVRGGTGPYSYQIDTNPNQDIADTSVVLPRDLPYTIRIFGFQCLQMGRNVYYRPTRRSLADY